MDDQPIVTSRANRLPGRPSEPERSTPPREAREASSWTTTERKCTLGSVRACPPWGAVQRTMHSGPKSETGNGSRPGDG